MGNVSQICWVPSGFWSACEELVFNVILVTLQKHLNFALQVYAVFVLEI